MNREQQLNAEIARLEERVAQLIHQCHEHDRRRDEQMRLSSQLAAELEKEKALSTQIAAELEKERRRADEWQAVAMQMMKEQYGD